MEIIFRVVLAEEENEPRDKEIAKFVEAIENTAANMWMAINEVIAAISHPIEPHRIWDGEE